MLALGASLLVLLSACTTGGGSTSTPSSSAPGAGSSAPASAGPSGSSGGEKAPIKIGSDGFYESQLVAEIWAQVLENDGYTVERNLGLGAREVSAAALESGQIDMKPEYLGSGLGFYKKAGLTDEDPTGDSAHNAEALAAALESKGISVLDYTPGQDTNAFVVRQDTADSLNLAKMSDLAPVATQLKWGLPPECATNPLCGGALENAYGIDVTKLQVTPLAACDAPIAQALQSKAVDVAELCSTQPAIAQFGFVELEDDKKTQPAENIAPLVLDDYLAKVDRASFEALLKAASDKLTTEELTKLGVEVVVNQKDVADVARTWLTDQGLL
jgi:osmoprotectant transport system substrate-binding protein